MTTNHTDNATADINATSRRTAMTQTRSTTRIYTRAAGVSTLALLMAAGTISPAYAAITNDATASGTYNGSLTPTTSNTSSETVPVAAPNGVLTVAKSVFEAPTIDGGANTSITDAGDTITYRYLIKNEGNVTMSGVTPVDTGPTFNGKAGTNGPLNFARIVGDDDVLAPGEEATYEAVYTMSEIDIFRAAGVPELVANSATASGASADADPSFPASNTVTTIPAGPHLTITKAAALVDGVTGTIGSADVGETINYTYTVFNSGNVPLTDVSINDVHEVTTILTSANVQDETLTDDGPLADELPTAILSSDTTPDDGFYSLLQPGATVTFTYAHTVTQAEVDAQ